jgi:two-component system nitrate/nitrite sensor histidine kinase NarX
MARRPGTGSNTSLTNQEANPLERDRDMRTDWPEQKVDLPPPGGRHAPDAGILAEITAGLAAGTDLHGLLERFLTPIMRMAGARAGAVRVLSAAGDRLQMISEVGLPEQVASAERAVDPACGMCGAAFTRGTIVSAGEVGHCARRNDDSYFGQQCRHLMAVPLTYRGRVLGLYNLFFDAAPAVAAESMALFKSIGELLGLALHNALLERDTLRAAVLTERQAMAAEVHDSIAQTLAFVKMRMPLLQEAISRHDEAGALKYCADVRQAVSSAHSNLREVLAHFRAPMDPLGLKHALQSSIVAFGELTQVELAFDDQVPGLHLPVAQELQVLRIVQEALANIAKHARASRAWLTIARLHGDIDVVVEDDGAGRRRALRPGHHAPACAQPGRHARRGPTCRRRHAGAPALPVRTG